ncbi:MAG TPA: ribosome silencing factor [Polyangia bacterium]
MTTKKSGPKKSAAKSAARREGPRKDAVRKKNGKAGAKPSKEAAKPGNKKAASKRPPRANVLPAAVVEKVKPALSPAKAKQLQEARVAAEAAIEAAIGKKALLPIVIDVSGQTTYTDFIGIVSGRSDRQVEAIAEAIVMALKAMDFRLVGREGSGNGRWTLLDFGDVVVHVFYHPVREFYDIESLWIDAPRLKLKVPPEAMTVPEEALYYERP